MLLRESGINKRPIKLFLQRFGPGFDLFPEPSSILSPMPHTSNFNSNIKQPEVGHSGGR